VWKVYNTAELNEVYVLLDLLLGRYRNRNRQKYAEALEFGHPTTPHRIGVHNQR